MPLFTGLFLISGASGIPLGVETPASNKPESTMSALVIKVIDEKYLYAQRSTWPKVREAIATIDPSSQKDVGSELRIKLALLRDSELHLVTPEEVAAIQEESVGRKLGCGLMDFSIDSIPDTGDVRIVTPLIGSPAALAGLVPRDVILKVNGEDTRNMDHEQVLDQLRANSTSSLLIRRGNRTFSVHVARSDAPLQPIFEELLTVRRVRVGYIRIVQFTPDVAAAVRSAVENLKSQRATAYVIDLRNNPGGFLGEATKIAGLFVSGQLGDKLRRDGTVESIVSDGRPALSMKTRLALLVNEGTASASEFLAGSLRDRKRALLIGTPTFGRGQAQVFQALPGNYGLIIPSALLRTPSGQLFKGTGVAPDITVRFKSMVGTQVNPSADPQLRKALAVVTRSAVN